MVAATAGQERKESQDTHTQTSFPTIGPVVILQGTDDFIIGVGDRERAGQRCPGRHGLHESVQAAGLIRRGWSASKHTELCVEDSLRSGD